MFQEAFLSTGVGLGSVGLRRAPCFPAIIVHAFNCAVAFPKGEDVHL